MRIVLWGAAVLGFAAIGWVMLAACGAPGWLRPLWLDWCPAQAATPPDLQRLLDERAALAARLDAARSRLASAPHCPIPEPIEEAQLEPPAEEPAQEPPEEPEVEVAEAPPLDCAPASAEDVILLVDVSPSMGFDYETREASRRRCGARGIEAGVVIGCEGPGTDRIDLARRALQNFIGAVPDAITFDLQTFSPCNRNPRGLGQFGARDRDQMSGVIQGIRANGNGTNIAGTIRAVTRALASRADPSQPVNVVMVTDGDEQCERGNPNAPCAAAEEFKRQVPNGAISVISLFEGANDGRCIAEATGGQFLRPDRMDELPRLLRRAAGAATAEDCAPQ